MKPRVEVLCEKKLVGKRLMMRWGEEKVRELWRSFMPRRPEITNCLTNNLISVAVYKPEHFDDPHSALEFERWATVEVVDFGIVPEDMEALTLPRGLYAVFDYKGSSSDHSIFQYIFGTWLPGSQYAIDTRPHFEVMGDKYKNNDPSSEEEIWIPIKTKDGTDPGKV